MVIFFCCVADGFPMGECELRRTWYCDHGPLGAMEIAGDSVHSRWIDLSRVGRARV
jgi:hypothetical protein